MNHPTISTWAVVNEGCSITCNVSGSNLAHLLIGDNQLELNFDNESLRELVTRSTAALAEMEIRIEQEEAEQAAQDQGQLAELPT